MAPRPDLDARAAALGFTFKDVDGQPYWDEGACYLLSLDEVERDLEGPTAAVAALCLEVAARAAHDDATLSRLGVPAAALRMVAESWERRDATLYGRFDLAYDGTGPAKVLEYNADTPTSLYESAVFQWFWLEDMRAAGALPPSADQFNSLHVALVDRWREVAAGRRLHLASMPNDEDAGTVAYLADCARQAGLEVATLAMREIGLRGDRFVDLGGTAIDLLFKLYPWEWVLADPFGTAGAMARTRLIEPAWKMMLSTKALLPLLWDHAPGHPNLLPCFFEDDPRCDSLGSSFARKPVHSREGANVTLVRDGAVAAATGGSYGAGPHVRQALVAGRRFDGNLPVIGSWVVGAGAHGIGIREDAGAITSNTSRFVPHAIVG